MIIPASQRMNLAVRLQTALGVLVQTTDAGLVNAVLKVCQTCPRRVIADVLREYGHVVHVLMGTDSASWETLSKETKEKI